MLRKPSGNVRYLCYGSIDHGSGGCTELMQAAYLGGGGSVSVFQTERSHAFCWWF